MTDLAALHRTIEAVWKMESARVIAGLARVLRGDVGLAEEAAQDALVAAMTQWPASGVPDNPGAWLMATAKKRAIDATRRNVRFKGIQGELAHDLRARQDHGSSSQEHELVESILDGEVQDDVLRLLFMACHPVLSADARSALTLRLLCGLTSEEIARAFLMPEATIAQRIVRAKRALAEHKVTLDDPTGSELVQRLPSVLEVLYLLFNEGYAATSGEDWMRPSLCEEAMRLARVLAAHLPDEAEVHGLVALLQIQASRFHARVDSAGNPILLLDQDRTRWDRVLIRRGLAALDAALSRDPEPGVYTIQASIAACHARATTPGETDWKLIAALYARLSWCAPSPIIELNRGVAVAMACGPQAGLDIVDALANAPSLASYHLLPSVRGDLLSKLGRWPEARREFERAASLTQNLREREVLLARARACIREHS